MSEWKNYVVTELETAGLLKIEDGNHGEYRPLLDEFGKKGTPFIRASDMDNGKILFQSASRINQIALARIRKGIGCPGDTLFSSKGTVGKVALAPLNCEPFICSPQVTFWRSLNKNFLDYRFLYYYIQSSPFLHQVSSRVRETDMAPYISLTNQRTFKLFIPPLEEQKQIADILSCLDNKIDNLRRQNETLEKIAQTLFKHWFIDFEFPNDDGKPYKSSGGAMVASELGDIPAGWTTKPLDEIADFLNGLALQKYPPENEKNFLPVIKIRELRTGVTDGTDRATTNIPEKYIIDNGDIIFSWSGSLDVVIWNFGKGALNQHLFKVDSHKYPKWLYYYWTLNHLQSFQHIAKSKATTMGHIQRKHLTEALCNVPNYNFSEKASEVFSPILQKIINNAQQIQTLTKTRDTLLPKLMSGQIRVKEGESIASLNELYIHNNKDY